MHTLVATLADLQRDDLARHASRLTAPGPNAMVRRPRRNSRAGHGLIHSSRRLAPTNTPDGPGMLHDLDVFTFRVLDGR